MKIIAHHGSKKHQHHHSTPFTSTTSTPFATCLRQKNRPSDWPILTKSSSINPREVIAGVPTRRPLGFIALLGWKHQIFLLGNYQYFIGWSPRPSNSHHQDDYILQRYFGLLYLCWVVSAQAHSFTRPHESEVNTSNGCGTHIQRIQHIDM